VFGCILIGGGSTRMGRPKHLLPCADDATQTWLHRTLRVLQPICRQVVLAGGGAVPEDLASLPKLPDPPGIAGPMAGLLSAMRWAPRASWLLAACDLPRLSQEAVEWILAQRAAGVWAVLPRLADRPHVEPLLAWYDFRCHGPLESMAVAGCRKLRELAGHPQTRILTIPASLVDAWSDADTPC
jgi:molybdopterin-guanine dinucleotide biosynthesis protein A